MDETVSRKSEKLKHVIVKCPARIHQVNSFSVHLAGQDHPSKLDSLEIDALNIKSIFTKIYSKSHK